MIKRSIIAILLLLIPVFSYSANITMPFQRDFDTDYRSQDCTGSGTPWACRILIVKDVFTRVKKLRCLSMIFLDAVYCSPSFFCRMPIRNIRRKRMAIKHKISTKNDALYFYRFNQLL